MTRQRNKKLLYAFLSLFLLVVSIIGGWGFLPAFADTSSNTSALTDLQNDSTFRINSYPDNAKDYSMNVIQIAESTGGELFVYTYQPCQKTTYLVATKVNISLTDKIGGAVESKLNDKPKFYGLTLINTSGVFGKYKVNGFTVSSDIVRYYNITSVYRDWIKSIDGEAGNDNSKIGKYFKVGKLFTAETVDGSIKYSCKNVDTVEIKNPYVDYISYGQSSGWDLIFEVTNWTDIHYVAFSTDKKIDTLKEADVTYTTQSYHFTGKNDKGYTYGEKSEPQYLTLTGKEEIGIDGYKQYTWKSIYRTEDFVKTTNLTGEAKKQVEKSEFVLVFLKTSFKEQEKWSLMQGHYIEADGTKVSDVSILRLMFETDGVCYNLGALMDIQEGDDKAGNKPNNKANKNFWDWLLERLQDLWKWIKGIFRGLEWWKIVLIVLGVFIGIFVILGLVFTAVRQFLSFAIKKLIQGLWFLICLPFKGLKRLFGGE